MKEFVQLLKLPPIILAAVAMGTGLILFLPTKIIQKLGLDKIPEEWKTVLGLALVISSSLLTVYFIAKMTRVIVSKYYWLRFKWGFPKVMTKLRSSELAVVALLYRSPNYTSRLPYTDGITARLLSKNVIQATSSNNLAYGDELSIPFTITPIAQEYIDKHPSLIKNFSHSELKDMYRRYNNPLY
ncbi:super-infection exclusion protein B [Abiotrophia defectiva]|uniref:super-infection exclusion protein B n=1 Tax=Abiotrophia defectiva TaxID=46125 RepID=UPI0028D8D2AB|nr:super-infection exclusion protein B [Abiotrophia defectiva]